MKQSILSKASWVFVSEELQKMFFSNGQTKEVENEIKNLHQRLYEDENLCWLKTIMEGNHWRRDQIFHFAEIVRLDLMKTIVIATQCANISSSGSAEKIQREMHAIGIMLQEISSHIATWIEKKLDERQLASICPEYYCIQLSDINGINAFVVRYQEGQYDKALNAFAWFDESMQLKMQALIESWQYYNASQPLSTLVNQMKEKIEAFADPDLYANVVNLRTWMFFKKATATLGLMCVRSRPNKE
ncbi:hypothetical protein niasHS_009670 [Heterodera schachtii]|uniref:Uncharacterized protein n=1 Tax=Heterodera schachtii TaxID=97005 RepID=A0ABD2J0T6_HETSC